MPQLIKNNQLVTNDAWVFAEDDTASISDKSFISIEKFLGLGVEDLPENIGVYLTSKDDVQNLAPHLSALKKVAIRVENFMDGRNFSQARILREQLGFEGDIRVVGQFIQDQLFFLQRCGFNEFAIEGDIDLEEVQQSLSDFSETYQAACDTSEPLFRRR